MKRYSLLTSAFALAALLASCGKTGVSTPPLATCEPGTEITFSTKGLDFSIESKATVVTEVPTFNVIAATGAAGSQADYWGGSVTATQSGASWLTGKYWEITDPGITSFYASNAALTFNAAGPTVTLGNCATDVVAAHCASPSYASSNDLTFNHVLTRLGSITLNTQSGYELSAVSATLTDGRTAGTYNLRTGAWSSLGARSAVAAGDFSGNTSAQTSANDKWFVPGSYTFSVSYTLTKGDYVQSFTKTGTVTLVAGKKNNLTATAVGGSAQEIVFNVSVTEWSPNPVDLDWEPTFAGLEIAPGPLYYNGTSYEIKDSWNYDSYESSYGKDAGSTYFSFIEMGQLFEKADFSSSDGNIENLLNPLNGWRLPTQTEWADILGPTLEAPTVILGTTREGSTVNGSEGKHYALVKLTGVTHAGSSTPNGLLIFPDGKTITGKALSGMDNNTLTTGVTESELNVYLSQGCMFLPGSGYRDYAFWWNGGSEGYYYTSTELSSSNGIYLDFRVNYLTLEQSDDKTYYRSVRLVR